MAFLPIRNLSSIFISLLMLVIAGLLYLNASAQSTADVICFNREDALPISGIIATLPPTYTRTQSPTPSPSPMATRTTVSLPSVTMTLTPFPTQFQWITQTDPRLPTFQTPSEFFLTATGNSPTPEDFTTQPTTVPLYPIMEADVISASGVRTRTCIGDTCSLNPSWQWIKSGDRIRIPTNFTFCRIRTIDGVRYYTFLTENNGWVAYKNLNNTTIFLRLLSVKEADILSYCN